MKCGGSEGRGPRTRGGQTARSGPMGSGPGMESGSDDALRNRI